MNVFKNYDGKNHNFGRLVDGILELSPAALIVNKRQYIGNNATRYANAGYLPIAYTDKPEDTGEGHYEAVYTEIDGTIVQSWEFVSDIPKGYIDTTKITNFSYFCAYNRFNDDLDKIIVPSGLTDLSYMFSYSDTLEQVPTFDTSSCTDFSYMFKNCKALKNVPLFDTSNGTDFTYFIETCSALTEIPSFNTSNGTTFNNSFANNIEVVTIGEIDLSKAESINCLFRNDYALETLTGLTFNSMPTSKMSSNIFFKCAKLKNITIHGTIKVDSNDLKLDVSSKLTVDSMLSILNSLEDNTGEETRYTVYFGSTNLAKLTDEQKAIAENKNISLG